MIGVMWLLRLAQQLRSKSTGSPINPIRTFRQHSRLARISETLENSQYMMHHVRNSHKGDEAVTAQERV